MPFLAIAAAFVAFGYSFLHNYSVSNQIQAAIRRFVGIDDNFKTRQSANSGGVGSHGGSHGPANGNFMQNAASAMILEKLIASSGSPKASQRNFSDDVETAISGAFSSSAGCALLPPFMGGGRGGGGEAEGEGEGGWEVDDDLGFMYADGGGGTEMEARDLPSLGGSYSPPVVQSRNI